jgi:hypothetical protein
MIACSAAIQSPVWWDLPGIIGTVGRVTVLRAAEGCKGVADAALPAATCAVASVWQKLAYLCNCVKKWHCHQKMHPCMPGSCNLHIFYTWRSLIGCAQLNNSIKPMEQMSTCILHLLGHQKPQNNLQQHSIYKVINQDTCLPGQKLLLSGTHYSCLKLYPD